MKTLITILLAVACFGANAQTTLKVKLKPNGTYSIDTVAALKKLPDNPGDLFRIGFHITSNGYIFAKYKDKDVFIDTSQIKHSTPYNSWIVWVMNQQKPNNPYDLKLKIDTINKLAYYQKIVPLDSTISINELHDRLKQFIANNIAAAAAQIQDNKLVYTTVQNLFIPQGFGSMEFGIKYTMTVEVKQGRYRYTITNVEIAYETLMVKHGKRESLYDEYQICNKGIVYGNHLKRIISLEKHLDGVENNLKVIMTEKSKITASDF